MNDVPDDIVKLFPVGYNTLRSLVGRNHWLNADNNDEYMQRMNHIYITCREAWIENLENLKGKPVKYLLIGEAAPWTCFGEVKYFYNTFSSSLHSLWWKAFSDESIPSKDRGLKYLGEQGFLLIDMLPFSIKYESRFRHKPEYRQLINLCKKHFLNQLQHDSLTWDKKVRVAFAFKLSGEQFIHSYRSILELPKGQTVKLHTDMIAADGSGFTNSQYLRSILGIDD